MLTSGMLKQKLSAEAYKQFQGHMYEGKTALQALGLIAHQAFTLQFDETRACTYCSKELEAGEVNIDDLCNQLCCKSCLFSPDRTASWWGDETDLALEDEDSFDIDTGEADEELRQEVPWHVTLSLMKSNQKLVPSTGGSKTKYYNMVSSGNVSRKWKNESMAVQREMDNKRKREERQIQRKQADAAALKKMKPRDIRDFFGTNKSDLTTSMYPSVLALPSPPLNFTEELQDLQEELNTAVTLMRRQMCVGGDVPAMRTLSPRQRLQLLQQEMLKTNNGNLAILLQAYLKL